MKVILSGATGFIGSETLRQCLKSPSITSVVALSRRNLPDAVTSDPKLKVIIMKDFKVYSEDVLEELAGVEACIWALGRPLSTHEVEVEYPMAAVNAFTTSLAPQLHDGNRFRFVYLSGMLVERDQNKTLWLGSASRKLKGETENGLIDLGSRRSDQLQTFICRPGYVFSRQSPLSFIMASVGKSVKVEELATAMLKTAMEGSTIQIMENSHLRTVGQATLKVNAG